MSDVFNGAVLRQAEDIEAALENFSKVYKQLEQKTEQIRNELKAKQVRLWWGGTQSAYSYMLSKKSRWESIFNTIYDLLYNYGVISRSECTYYNKVKEGHHRISRELSNLYTEGQPAYLTPIQNAFVKYYQNHSGVLGKQLENN